MVTRPRKDWISRTPKWVLLAAFWVVQGAVLFFGQALLYISQSKVDKGHTNTPGPLSVLDRYTPDRDPIFFGSWPSIDEYIELLTTREFALWTLGGIAALTLGQSIFVWPVRRPGIALERHKGLRMSLLVAGLMIGLLTLAAFLAIAGAFDESYIPIDAVILLGSPWTTMTVVTLAGWAVATPLMFAFVKGGRKETVLARLSRRLLLGTMVEVALLIPLDVMVRRKTSCYCWAGTYWALTVCGAVGVFALGPAVFLPLVARRRKAWYAGHCGVCGYDMAGRMDAPKCPECGTGWRA